MEDPEERSFTVEDTLPCKHSYTVSVAAVNEAGVGPASKLMLGKVLRGIYVYYGNW